MRALTGAAAAAMAGILAALLAGAVWVATLHPEPQGRPTIPAAVRALRGRRAARRLALVPPSDALVAFMAASPAPATTRRAAA